MSDEELKTLGLTREDVNALSQEYKKEAEAIEDIINTVERKMYNKNPLNKTKAKEALYKMRLAREGFAATEAKANKIFAESTRFNYLPRYQKIRELEARRRAAKNELEAIREAGSNTVPEGYEQFLHDKIAAIDKEYAVEKSALVDERNTKLREYIPYDEQKGELTETDQQLLTDAYQEQHVHEYRLKSLDKEYQHLQTEEAEAEAAKKTEEAVQKLKDSVASAKASKIFAPLDALNKKDDITEAELEEAHKAILESDEYKNADDKVKKQVADKYKAAKKKIADAKAAVTGKDSSKKAGKAQKTLNDAATDSGAATLSDEAKKVFGLEDDTDLVAHSNLDDAGTKALSSEVGSNKDTVGNGKFLRKKDTMVSMAYVNVLYDVDPETGLIYDKEGTPINPNLDSRLVDFATMKPGQPLEIVIDTDWAEKNNIPINEENWWRIPFGIKLPNGDITGHIHILDADPKRGRKKLTPAMVDSRVRHFLQKQGEVENEQYLVEGQLALERLRKGLVKEFVKNGKNKVDASIKEKSSGHLKFTTIYQPSSEVFNVNGDFPEGVFFAVVDDLGGIKTNPFDSKKLQNYVFEDFKGLKNFDYKKLAGIPVALVPTNARHNGRVVLRPVLMGLNSVSEEDLDIMVDIMLMSIDQLKEIKGLPEALRTHEDAINTLVYNGINSKNFLLLKRKDGSAKLLTEFVTDANGNRQWLEKTGIIIDESNRDAIKSRLRGIHYNVNIKASKAFKPQRNEDGSITFKTVSNNFDIASKTRVNIEANPIPGTKRLQFAFQPNIVLDVPGITSTEQKSPTQTFKETLPFDEDEDMEANPSNVSTTSAPLPSDKIGTAETDTLFERLTESEKSLVRQAGSSDRSIWFRASEALFDLQDANPEGAVSKFLESLGDGLILWAQDKFSDTYIEQLEKAPAKLDKLSAISRLEMSENPKNTLFSLVEESSSQAVRDITRRLYRALRGRDIKVEFVRRGLDGAVARAKYGEGRYVVEINKDAFIYARREAANIIAHELLHLATGAALRNPQTIEEKAFATGIKSLYEKAKRKLKGEWLGLKNEREFVSEVITNPEFRDALRKRNFLEMVYDLFLKIIGRGEDIVGQSEQLINSFLDEGYVKSPSGFFEDNILNLYAENGFTNAEVYELLGSINRLALLLRKENPAIPADEMYDRVRKQLNWQARSKSSTLVRLGKATERERILLEKVLANKGDNPIFKDLVERSTIFMDNTADILRDFETQSDLDQEEETDASGGKENYGKEAWEINPKSTASKRMKFRLTFVPMSMFLADGKLVVRPNSFGMESFVPFDILYNTIAEALHGLPPAEFMNKLETLAEYNPSLKFFIDDLIRAKNSKDINEVAYYQEFHSHFQKQKARMITAMFRKTPRQIEEMKFNDWTNYITYANLADADASLLSTWHDMFRFSSVVKLDDSGNKVVDLEKAAVLQKAYDEYINNKTLAPVELYEVLIQNVLKPMGITMPAKAAHLMATEPNLISKSFKPQEFVTAVGRIVKRLNTEVAPDPDNPQEFAGKNPFTSEGKNLRTLAKVAITIDGTMYSSLYRNEEGKNIYTLFHNNLLSKTIEGIEHGNLLEEMLADEFRKDNKTLQQLKDGEVDYKLFYFSTLAEDGSLFSGATFKNLSPQDREYARWIMFLNGGKTNDKGQLTGFFQAPTISDKPTIPVIQTKRLVNTFGTGKLSREALHHLLGFVLSEHKRIRKVKEEIARGKVDPSYARELIENYHYKPTPDGGREYNKASGLLFHFFPTLNTLQINGESLSEIEDLGTVRDTIIAEIEKAVADEIAKVKEKFQEYGFMNENVFVGKMTSTHMLNNYETIDIGEEEDAKTLHEHVLDDYVVNYMIQYGNFYQVFANDIAFTKGYTDAAKRLAMVLAPGQDTFRDGNMRVVMYNDVSIPSSSLIDLRDALVNSYLKVGYKQKEAVDEANKLVQEYTNINNTDAQGYVTIHEYERILEAFGRLDAETKTIIDHAKNGTLHTLDLKKFSNNAILQPMKPVYVGDVHDPVLGRTVRKYIKLSIIPLYKELTQDFADLDAFREQLEKNNVGLAAYASAGKTGNKLLESFYDAEGNVTNISPSSVQEMPYTGFRLQQEVPYDRNKKQIRTVSQARKMVLQDLKDHMFAKTIFQLDGVNFTPDELYKHHEDLYIQNLNDEFDNFVDEFGVEIINESGKPMTFKITDINKVNAVLLKEARKRGYSENALEALQLTPDGKDFVVPLWFTPQSEQFETLLLSIISARIAKRKQPGKSLVQASNQGFGDTKVRKSSTLSESEINSIDWIDEETKQNFLDSVNGKLKGVRYDSGNHKLKPEQILLPNIFAKKFKKGNKISYAALKEAGLLNVFGMRIPNQGHNSMASLEIAGFLPEASGDTVIVHQDMLKRMGSDFDVDKLFIYLPEFYVEGGVAKRIKYHTNVNNLTASQRIQALDEMYRAKMYDVIQGNDNLKAKYEAFDADSDKILTQYHEWKKESTGEDKIFMQELIEEELALRMARMSAVQSEAVRMGLMPTREEFAQLPELQQNSIAARHNRILDMYLEVFSHPEILTKTLMPNTVDPLRNANNRFDALEPTASVETPLSTITQDNFFEDNSSGKVGIGIASLWNTFHSTAQYHRISLKEIGTNKETGEVYVNAVGPKFLVNKTVLNESKDSEAIRMEKLFWEKMEDQSKKSIPTIYKSFGLTRMGKTRGGVQGTFISYILQVLQSAAVDNAKEQELNRANLNNETFNTAMYLAAMGIDDFNLIVGMMRQPIIKEWVQEVRKRKTKAKEYYEGGSVEGAAFAAVWRKYTTLGAITEDDAISRKDFIRAFSLDDFRNGIAHGVAYKKFGEEYPQIEKFADLQIEVLKAFMQYKTQADAISKTINALNTDTRSIGKNWFEVNRGLENAIDGGILPSDRNSMTKALFNGLSSLRSTLNGEIIGKGLVLGHQVFNTDWLFPYARPIFKKLYLQAYNDLGRNLTDKEARRLKGAFLQFLASNLSLPIYENLNPELNAMDLRYSFTKNSQNSIDKVIMKLKEHPSLRTNLFLQRLNVGKNKTLVRNNMSKADFYHLNMEPNEVDHVVDHLLNLLNHEDPEIRNATRELIMYSYLVEGVNRSGSGVAGYIPLEYLLDKKLPEVLRTLDYVDANEIFYKRFLNQFARNNPDALRRLPLIRGKYTRLEDNSITLNTGDSFFPEYVLISLGNRDVVHQLVANPEFGVAVYSPQEPLGMARVFEYDYNRSNVRSAFKKNHFKEGSQRSESVTSTFLAGLGIETKKAETETSSTLFDESTGGEGAAVISKEASSILFGGLPESTETSQASPEVKAKGKMTFAYGNNKRSDIFASTTIEAIKRGERTATTRYESDGNIDYWKSLKVGDVIEWEGKNGEKVLVVVTKPLHKLSGSNKTAEQWSKLEGWSVEYFNSKVRPRLDEAWQIEYKLVDDTNTQASPVDSAREDLHAKVTELGDKFTDRQRTIWTKKINDATTEKELGAIMKKLCKFY